MWEYLLIGYFVIGFFMGVSHLSSGRVGFYGPLPTLLAHVVAWPLILLAR